MYKWAFRIAIVAVIAFLTWQWLSARTERDVAVERANGNYRLAQIAQERLTEANAQIVAEVQRSNLVVQSLADAAKAQRDTNAPRIDALVRLSAVWADRANRLDLPRAEICEDRLRNIDTFLGDYIKEVQDAPQP
jgi:type II secretory pathway pseudopilin PulG